MKKVLITGASSGLGYAMAQKFIEQGEGVIGIARQFSDEQKGQMRCLQLDLADLDQIVKGLDGMPELKSIDRLVLNAGVGLFGGLEQLSYSEMKRTLDINLVSNLYLLKYFLPSFKKEKGKDIVIVGSESAISGAKQGAVYCASKFGLRGLAQSLRADCGGADIRVFLLNPGPISTPFFDDLHFQPKQEAGCFLHAEEVADTVIHALAMPRSVVQDEITINPAKRAFESK